MISLLLLGSTGSIGNNVINIVRENIDKYRIIGIAANSSLENLIKQAKEFNIKYIGIYNKEICERARQLYPEFHFFCGLDGILEMVKSLDYDYLVNAIVGGVGLLPSYYAVGKAKRIALANKESLVVGGYFLKEKLNNSDTELIPVDSEHSAVFQSIGNHRAFLKKIVLTASGGPFYFKKNIDFSIIKPEEALKHPTWNMGKKITIDSATMFNKALEIIEAYHLFDLKAEQIEVIIHPQSYIHSFVEFIDGIQIAQMSIPDMKFPIQYALSYPDRLPSSMENPPLYKLGKLEFYEPDMDRFKSIKIAYESLKSSKVAPAVLNYANEVAVDAFLQERISFDKIFAFVESSISRYCGENINDFDNFVAYIEELIIKLKDDLKSWG